MSKLILLLFAFLNSSNLFSEIYSDHYGEIEISSTIFTEDIPNDNRENYLNASKLEYNYFFQKNNLSGKFKINVNESYPNSNSNINFKEAYLSYSFSDKNILIGNNIITWGENKFFNPGDIINSNDFSLGLKTSKKIGQPMIMVKKNFSSSVLDFYLLTSEENIYPDSQVRPQLSRNISNSSIYSKGADNNNLGIALKWSVSLDEHNYGFSFYQGNTKDPALNVISNILVPNYSEITQLGFNVQTSKNNYLLKGEIISRSNQYNIDGKISDYYGYTLGIEHSSNEIFKKSWVLNNTIEYSNDSRGSNAHHEFQNDLFYGIRLELNNNTNTHYFILIQNDLEKNTRSLNLNYENSFFPQLRGGIDIYLPLNLEREIFHQSSFKDENNFRIYTNYSF